MQRRPLSLLAALTAALAMPAIGQAAPLSYSYVEAAYLDTEIDNGPLDLDGSGLQLRGSLPINQNFFVFAGYSDIGFDHSVDATALHVGLGGHLPIQHNIDLVGRVAVVKADLKGRHFGVRADDDGFLLGAHVRAAIAPRWEVEGGLEYVNLDDGGSDTSVLLEGRYFFLDNLAGGLLLDLNDDGNTLGVGVRLTF